uniref:DUF4395 family protein n=1 Tax=Cellulomonas pakistanensis TaxID=992287 RepID=UPI0035715A9F
MGGRGPARRRHRHPRLRGRPRPRRLTTGSPAGRARAATRGGHRAARPARDRRAGPRGSVQGLLLAVLGVPGAVPVAAALALVAAVLDAAFGLCLGCELYLLGARLRHARA